MRSTIRGLGIRHQPQSCRWPLGRPGGSIPAYWVWIEYTGRSASAVSLAPIHQFDVGAGDAEVHALCRLLEPRGCVLKSYADKTREPLDTGGSV